MKPIKVSHLSLIFVGLIVVALLGLGTMMWSELGQLTSRIRAQETQAAGQEVNEGLERMEVKLRDVAEALGRWDETRQQLVYPDYYMLWRDLRVRDAGMVPDMVNGVALYDRQGRILGAAHGEFMPATLNQPVARIQFSGAGDEQNLYVFFPVHADQGSTILLGHGGIKINFPSEFGRTNTFRYADINSLAVHLDARAHDTLRATLASLTYDILPNQDLASIKQVLEVTFMRLLAAVLAILVLATWIFQRALISPLNRISRDIDALKDAPGDSRRISPLEHPMRVQELENVRRSFRDYHDKLNRLRQDLEKNSQDFFDQARHDALTGVFNRRAFDEDWNALADAGYLGKCALLLFDCDHFKTINDSYGHAVGDKVIQAIATSLSHALRTGDRLYRLGGDEFATMLPNSDTASAEAVAERCLHHIQAYDFKQYGLNEPVMLSIGIALSEHSAFNLHELHSHADLAMYSAKRPGNRKHMFYHGDIDGMANLLSSTRVNAVYNAIQNPENIQLHYQPIVELPSTDMAHVEALARLRQGEQLLMPGEFLSIVQEHRLDVEFDLAVLRSLEDDMRIGRIAKTTGVSINVSPPGIVDAGLVSALLALKAHQPERKIIIEVTEQALITQIDKASEHLRQLRAAGCLIALDDFGSGYSSLRYLACMPVDMVKFDISMIHQLSSDDPKQRLIVGEIANIVSANGYLIVAEGVESAEHLERVVALGFNYAQGFLFR
jgi:diguanylate cyclase (GGDEF)-like protein